MPRCAKNKGNESSLNTFPWQVWNKRSRLSEKQGRFGPVLPKWQGLHLETRVAPAFSRQDYVGPHGRRACDPETFWSHDCKLQICLWNVILGCVFKQRQNRSIFLIHFLLPLGTDICTELSVPRFHNPPSGKELPALQNVRSGAGSQPARL